MNFGISKLCHPAGGPGWVILRTRDPANSRAGELDPTRGGRCRHGAARADLRGHPSPLVERQGLEPVAGMRARSLGARGVVRPLPRAHGRSFPAESRPGRADRPGGVGHQRLHLLRRAPRSASGASPGGRGAGARGGARLPHGQPAGARPGVARFRGRAHLRALERKLEDIERLREYGFDDVAILKATEITAYYNAINRVVCALGVSLEAGLEAWEFGAQK